MLNKFAYMELDLHVCLSLVTISCLSDIPYPAPLSCVMKKRDLCPMNAWVKVFRINSEFRILRLTFHRKSASKCPIVEIIIASLINFQII